MSFDFQPTLNGDLVELRPLNANDASELLAVASDPLIWEQHPAHDRHKPDVFAAFFAELLGSKSALTAIDRKTGKIIGASRFHGYNEDSSEVEIGWTFLARTHWGGKYNGEIKRLMLRHAFRYVRRVVLLVSPLNIRSQKAVERLGAVRVGSRPDAAGRNSYVYEITSMPLKDAGVPS